MVLANVRMMENKVNPVYKTIETHLRKMAKNSKNTAVAYESDIRQFFGIMRNKPKDEELETLTLEDLQFKRSDIDAYIVLLLEAVDQETGKTYAKSTINRKINALSSLFKNLESNEFPVKSIIFHKIQLKTTEPNRRPFINWEQAQIIMDYVKTTDKGNVKSILIELAVKTSFRMSCLLRLKWSDFRIVNDVCVVTGIDKGGKKVERSIQMEFYNRIKEIRTEGDKVFPFEATYVKNMVIDARKATGVSFTFHSFKKCGIKEVKDITGGDIKAMQKQGNHDDVATTIGDYDEFNKDYSLDPALQIGASIDLSPIHDISYDELVKAIEKCSRSLQMELLRKINELK